MNHVTDIREAGEDASVLTDAGSGGLIGRAVLSEAPLSAHLRDDETPRYVLRNKKHGVTVEDPDGSEEYAPDRGHSGVALVSDVRVLFAAGRSGDDLTVSVSLADVVDVRTEDGLIGGAFVVETVGDERYRFPCRGDLEPVREYLDAAVGVWTRAERHVEEAREQLDRLESAFESGNADVVLAATGDVEETLADARDGADALDGARAHIEERAAEVRSDLSALERRAHAEYAEQARERAHVRWDDGDYEAAMDNVDEADDAYAAALAIDGEEPEDELLTERRGTLAEERDRLSSAPLDRAEHAVDVAEAAGDPGSAVEWWETAVERYETALSLDWGRDDRRFAGTADALRDDLADAARNLVTAHCEQAREHVAAGDEVRDATPDRAGTEYERASEALAAAREVTRERVPDATDEIDAVAATLEERLESLSGFESPAGAEVDGGRTATAGPSDSTSSDDGSQEESCEDESGGDSGEDEPGRDSGGDEPGGDSADAGEGGTPDRTDDEIEVPEAAGESGPVEAEDDSAERPGVGPDPVEASSGDDSEDQAGERDEGDPAARPSNGDATEDPSEAKTDAESDPLAETQTVIGNPGDESGRGKEPDRTGENATTRSEDDESRPGAEPNDAPASEWRSAGELGDGDVPGEPSTDAVREEHVTDPAAVDADALPSVVARVFEAAGWSTTVFGAGTGDRYDLLAATDDPISLTVCVWTIHPETVETVDAATVERYANYFDGVDEADAAAVCSAAEVSETARARADDLGFELLDSSELADRLAPLGLDPEEF